MWHEIPIPDGMICCESRISITDRQSSLFEFPLWRRKGNRGSSDGRQFRSNFRDKPIPRGEKVHVLRQCIELIGRTTAEVRGGGVTSFNPRFINSLEDFSLRFLHRIWCGSDKIVVVKSHHFTQNYFFCALLTEMNTSSDRDRDNNTDTHFE